MPVSGIGPGGTAPGVPTAAQLAQLATLQAASAAAIATYHSSRLTYKTNHAAMLAAEAAVTQYQAYIYGGQKPGIYDEGIPAGQVQGDVT
jgi:hypothetical protein